MKWTENSVRAIIADTIADNFLASRALLSIAEIRFTDKVQTMSVSLAARPVLSINLDFCREHCRSENDIKTVLFHEFLHILLMHTVKYRTADRLLNIALDAIINSIIHRHLGSEYSDFFKRFYPWQKISFLLRPEPGTTEEPDMDEDIQAEWLELHAAIYRGDQSADDLYELLIYLRRKITYTNYHLIILLGEHSDSEVSGENQRIIEEILKKVKGKFFISSREKGSSEDREGKEARIIQQARMRSWETAVAQILKKFLIDMDRQPEKAYAAGSVYLPVLSQEDSRSTARFLVNGILPIARHPTAIRKNARKAAIYLDVSGSMFSSLDQLISVLYRFRKYIVTPFFVFSDEVSAARFVKSKLVFSNGGGTDLEPVISHIKSRRFKKALIITDGYVGRISPEMLQGIDAKNLFAVIDPTGSSKSFEDAGIPYRILPAY